MAETTPRLGLKKPVEGELDWDVPIRETIDIIDETVAEVQDDLSALTEEVGDHDTRDHSSVTGVPAPESFNAAAHTATDHSGLASVLSPAEHTGTDHSGLPGVPAAEAFTEVVHDLHEHAGLPGVIDPSDISAAAVNITATDTAVTILGEDYVFISDNVDALLQVRTSGYYLTNSGGDVLITGDEVFLTSGAGQISVGNFFNHGKGFVNHGASAGIARPTGFASIEWFGSVEPTNAVNGDTWVDTSA